MKKMWEKQVSEWFWNYINFWLNTDSWKSREKSSNLHKEFVLKTKPEQKLNSAGKFLQIWRVLRMLKTTSFILNVNKKVWKTPLNLYMWTVDCGGKTLYAEITAPVARRRGVEGRGGEFISSGREGWKMVIFSFFSYVLLALKHEINWRLVFEKIWD